MSKFQLLRVQVNQRLTAAVDEILGLFERTIVEYEEEFSRSQQGINHQHKQLRAAFNPEVRLHRGDIQQLLVQQEWSPSLDQEEPEPQHIKEEQKELWTSEEGEQLHGVEEAEIIKVHVKSEDDEREVQSTELHQNQTEENTEAELLPSSSVEQIKTGADGEDCGGADTIRNFDPDIQQLLVQQKWSLSLDQEKPEPPHIKEVQEALWISQEGEQLHGLKESVKSEDDEVKVQSSQLYQSQIDENIEEEPPSSIATERIRTEADGEDCEGQAENFNPGCNLQPASNDEASDTFETASQYREDDWKETRQHHSGFHNQKNYEVHVNNIRSNSGETSSLLPECGATFEYKGNLKRYASTHTGPFSYSICKNSSQSAHLKDHFKIKVKQFSCPVCGKNYTQKVSLILHMRTHTGKKPLSCSICSKNSTHCGDLTVHLRTHTGERPYSCSVCGKNFAQNNTLKGHMITHTGEKPFGCSVCGKHFSKKGSLKQHRITHWRGK